ncbi:hypothetical protein KR018_000161 [Drosophila ironensis]|nr:hypothetical protein KR018_000161 [Drosophila ironensis]
MTYSHNNVRNNIKMTTAAATKSIRLKKGAAHAASPPVTSSPSPTSVSSSISTPATPLVTAHSNSFASSTNNSNFLSCSPPNCTADLGLSTPNNQQHRLKQSQSQSAGSQRRQQQQRQSPQQGGGSGGGGAFFFANNNRRTGGGRSPQGGIAVLHHSPATILGGGFSPTTMACGGGSARKQRKSPPLGGKVSPQLIHQQHQLIPTALTHFAGSKCFDAPAPTALPKPPQHWTLSKSEEKQIRPMVKFQMPMMQSRSSKRNLLDDFDTHNLKLLLNVQS